MKDVPEAVVAEGLREYDTWRDAREEAIASGSMPSLSVRTATEWALRRRRPSARRRAVAAGGRSPSDAARPVRRAARAVRRTSASAGIRSTHVDRRRRARPRASRRRAVRRARPRDAGGGAARRRSRRDRRARRCARADPVGAGRGDRGGRRRRRSACWRTSCSAARAPPSARGACRRETPVTCTLPDGTLVEGVVDLAFEEHGALDGRRLQDRSRARRGRRRPLPAAGRALRLGDRAGHRSAGVGGLDSDLTLLAMAMMYVAEAAQRCRIARRPRLQITRRFSDFIAWHRIRYVRFRS